VLAVIYGMWFSQSMEKTRLQRKCNENLIVIVAAVHKKPKNVMIEQGEKEPNQ
jgi:hypothetical protein